AFSDKNITDVADIALDSLSADGTDVLLNSVLRIASGKYLADANANELLEFVPVASAVNNLAISNAQTGLSPVLAAAGTDANIDISITPKGTGEVNITKVDIDSGAIDGTTVGATTPAAGTFLALQTGANGTDGQLSIFSEQGGTDYFVTLYPNAAMTMSTAYTMPPDDGDASEVLTTDGNGNLTWTGAGANYWSKTGTDLSPATSGDDLKLNTGETLTIGGGTAITRHLSATGTIDFGNLSSNCESQTITVTGAATGDTVVATPTPVTGGIETLRMTWNGYVSAANTVTVRACAVANNQNAASQTWRADVWQH
ncbi:MAG: hypothetical protein JXA24_06455, partial [Proteobacteria bacterium]|nr:hypothetical protein [Pseudomonadota bacterium]